MNDEGREMGELDELLGAWAETVRLDDGRAEAIRLAVIGGPSPIDQTWWQDLFGSVTTVLLATTTLPPAARQALVPA